MPQVSSGHMTRDESLDQIAQWALAYFDTSSQRRQWLAEVDADGYADLAAEMRTRMTRIYRDRLPQGRG